MHTPRESMWAIVRIAFWSNPVYALHRSRILLLGPGKKCAAKDPIPMLTKCVFSFLKSRARGTYNRPKARWLLGSLFAYI